MRLFAAGLANSAEVGGYLRQSLDELKEKHPLVGDVRGMGLMQAIELVRDRKTKEPAAAETVQLLEIAKGRRILMGKGGLYGNVLRCTPPMDIGKSDVDEFVRQFDASPTKCEQAAFSAAVWLGNDYRSTIRQSAILWYIFQTGRTRSHRSEN